MTEQTLPTNRPQPTPPPIATPPQAAPETLQPPDFGDMVRDVLTKHLPEFIVNVYNTVGGIVVAVQDKLTQQQVANTELSFSGKPEAPQLAFNTLQVAQPYENSGIREIITRETIAIAQQSNINSVIARGGERHNSFFANAGFTPGQSQDLERNLNLDLQNPAQVRQLQSHLQGAAISPEQLQTIRAEMGIAPGTTAQDLSNQRGFESALWLTNKLGSPNQDGQLTYQVGNNTCTLDQESKTFTITDANQNPILAFRDGKLTGTLTTTQANNLQRWQGEALLRQQRGVTQEQNPGQELVR